MDTTLYIQETPQLSEILYSIRAELTNVITEAFVKQAYDNDIQLSFGIVHLNSKGSLPQISFNGTDVTDIDAFIVKQALKSKIITIMTFAGILRNGLKNSVITQFKSMVGFCLLY